jgi:hypothetical protein
MSKNNEILKEAKKRYDHCHTYWSEMKQKNSELLQFIAGDQWTYTARQNFENAGYAAMTSNRIPTFLRQITNEIRKNTPEIQIDPRTDADEEKAEVLNDLIRNIQEESKAEIAYCTAAESAASVGIGYIRVRSEYKDNKSMDQEIVIEAVEDVNTVMLDPNQQSLDGSDCEYAFISTTLSIEDYKRRYGHTKLARKLSGTETLEDLEELKEIGWVSSDQKWTNDGTILICEYYYKDYVTKKLYQVLNNLTGEIFVTDDVDKDMVKAGELSIIQERLVNEPIIRWCKLNDVEVLEETEWPGSYIPIVPVKGDEYWLEGKRKLVGAVEPAVEAQVQLNYAMSWRAQLLQMAPKAPYIGTAAQFKTYEQEWANINVSNQAFMTYNKDEGAPPPSRDLGEVPIQASTRMVEEAQEDLKSIFGTFDPSQSQVAPESGKAILARQHQAYNSNYHFYDNLSRSIQHVGCIIVEAIPVIYDSARNVQIMSQDGKKRSIAINQPNEAGIVEYDLTEGDYSVSIQTGPGFGTKRQETVEAVTNLISVYPQAAPAVADIAVRHMDWPGAKQIADSLEAMVPPQVLQARKANPKDAAALVPQLKSQVQMMQQHLEALNAHAMQVEQELKIAKDELQLEKMKSKVDMTKVQLDHDVKIKTLSLEEQKTELEFLVKEQEIKIQKEQLAIEKEKLALAGVEVATDMLHGAHEIEIQHIDRMNAPEIAEKSQLGDTEGLDKSLE